MSGINRILRILDVIDQICDTSTDDDDCNDDNDGTTTDDKASKRIRLTKESPLKQLRDIQNPLHRYAAIEFQQRYRFDKETVHDILQMIQYGLTKLTNRGQPVSPMLELLITLRFLATGSFQSKPSHHHHHTDDDDATNFTAVSQPTISRIIRKVTTLLSELKLRFIKIPADRIEVIRLARQFQQIGQFPDVFACVGSTHVAVKSPGKTVADVYMNELGFYSFRACMVCGPDLRFFEMISRWPGGTHENKIFNISKMYQRFEYQQLQQPPAVTDENCAVVLLADRNYSSRPFVMVPVEQPRNAAELKYNEAHAKTYVVPEAVALWKRRFVCLQTVLNNKEGMKIVRKSFVCG